MREANGGGHGALPAALAALALAGCGGGDGGTSHETGATAGDAPRPVGSAPAAPAGANAGAEDEPADAGLVPIGAAPVGGSGPATPSVPRPTTPRPPAPSPPSGAPTTPRPDQLQQLEDDPSRLEPLPDVAAVETTDSGLQVVYEVQSQRDAIEPDYVEAQWQHMQSCTEVVAAPPAVLIVAGQARPITASDDVIRAIDGTALATASTGDAGTTLQVTDADLLPDASPRGFALRAITGRWLWQGASLPERDYPFACANEGPAAGG